MKIREKEEKKFRTNFVLVCYFSSPNQQQNIVNIYKKLNDVLNKQKKSLNFTLKTILVVVNILTSNNNLKFNHNFDELYKVTKIIKEIISVYKILTFLSFYISHKAVFVWSKQRR